MIKHYHISEFFAVIFCIIIFPYLFESVRGVPNSTAYVILFMRDVLLILLYIITSCFTHEKFCTCSKVTFTYEITGHR